MALLISLINFGCGRTQSRWLGKDYRQVLSVQHMKRFISISFDRREDSTVKDVTYEATDGYTYTQEFKDSGVLEGTIRWVPAGESESFYRSRILSRWIGSVVDQRLPDDCKQVLGVDIGYASAGERVKNVTYLSTQNTILAKEYRDGWIGRRFEGWLEIKSTQ